MLRWVNPDPHLGFLPSSPTASQKFPQPELLKYDPLQEEVRYSNAIPAAKIFDPSRDDTSSEEGAPLISTSHSTRPTDAQVGFFRRCPRDLSVRTDDIFGRSGGLVNVIKMVSSIGSVSTTY